MTAAYKAKEHYQQEAVASAYDEVRFRGLRGKLVNWLEQRMLMKAVAGLPAGARILDLPVGTGRMSRRLEFAGYRVAGADISAQMLRVANGLSDGSSNGLVRADGETLPFPDNSFDAVVCFRLMSHLPPDARTSVLREMGRVASDRVIVVYQPHRFALWWLVYGLLAATPLPKCYVSAADLVSEFAAGDLRVVRSHSLLRGVLMERAYVLAPGS